VCQRDFMRGDEDDKVKFGPIKCAKLRVSGSLGNYVEIPVFL
jgi:hypothetical protein